MDWKKGGTLRAPRELRIHRDVNPLQAVHVTPHIVTNSFQERGLPIWEIFCFPAHSGMGTPRMVMGLVFLPSPESRVRRRVT